MSLKCEPASEQLVVVLSLAPLLGTLYLQEEGEEGLGHLNLLF
jgi:hypothetical protein